MVALPPDDNWDDERAEEEFVSTLDTVKQIELSSARGAFELVDRFTLNRLASLQAQAAISSASEQRRLLAMLEAFRQMRDFLLAHLDEIAEMQHQQAC